ncbi:phosphatidate cytidylyltransferase [Ectobacillus polymachus]|uniref:phosphatidate cytidylyltransferase n=1 Tax=Ectobacillus polymachus TaxID=1508806 RepID=UPI003A86EE6F
MKQRVITAVIAAALFIPIAFYGGVPFTVLVYFLAYIGLYELIHMKKSPIFFIPTLLVGILLSLLLVSSNLAYTFGPIGLSKVELTFVIVMLLLSYTVLSKNTFTIDDAAFLLFATLYIGMGFYYLRQTRIEGLRYLFYTLFVIWSTDSGAYFIGRAFGKRKLWPEISPNKTVEGAIGGIFCAVAVGLVYNMFQPVSENIVYLIAVTVLVAIFGQIGDLVESAFKRHYGVKDSGYILPGHGGILDRFDSLLFVLPLLHFLHFV